MIAALIALIAILMLGGAAGTGWTADLEKPVKKAVQEEVRRDAVLDALDAYENGMEQVGESVKDHFIQLLETHLDFQSSEKEFDSVAQKLTADQADAFAQDLKTRKTMKTHMTPEEWNAVFRN